MTDLGWGYTCYQYHVNLRCVRFLFGKKKIITVSLDKCASHASKQMSSARWVSPSARPLFCDLLSEIPFFVLAHGYYISFLRTVYRLCDERLSSKTVWQKLIQNWAFGLVKKVSTRTLKRFIPGNCRWDSSKYVVSSVATFRGMSFRQPTGKGTYLILFLVKISSWTKLPLRETSLRAPFKSSKQTTDG